MNTRSPASILLIYSLLALGTCMLGGCGQRGPLRLPVLPAEAAAPATDPAKPVSVSPVPVSPVPVSPVPASPVPISPAPASPPAVIDTAPK